MTELIFDLQVFLLNLSFIFLLFFIYHKYIEGKISKVSNAIFIGIISAVSILLCMSFPLSPFPGFLFDYRLIPFIIGTLYGGRRVGLVLLTVLLAYRFMISLDEGFYASIIVYTLMLLFLSLMTPYFKRMTNLHHKLALALIVNLIGIISLLTVLYFFNVNISVNGWLSLILFYFLQLIAMFLFINFIERAKKESIVLSEIKELEKLKVVSDIAASISHEVRNPLTVTKGFLQLLQDHTISLEKKEFYIKLSLEELERAEEIISDYLTFAKPSIENIDLLELNREIQYILKVITPYATMRDIDIMFEKTDDVFIAGERQKLHQALINLAKNGIEAMSPNGKLTIKLTSHENMAHIIISDTGIGMNEEQVRRLGTPYYSTKTTGTGLGTMVAFSIIKAMRGHLSVKSSLGEGTTFTLTIPLVQHEESSHLLP
ncbi:sensor histidine kinase [Halalkalibacter akibai]|uniref:histidine kinase n=1 Tax=Halalkalibacter akibai (strain ATCC 43226 / DSM 21942 / CIP 109018 / JCM 9157 / 1139) TaxID=1236973 RepID=W4QMP4_HALA3|nr:HAMP domain-containing sensor histidine kinase [Halalkalibacter akibai]GAE33361.1 sporulation kinase B homolog 2 [Halalkalibacter akibai JCM 9157]